MKKKKLLFLCGGNDFQAMDKFKVALRLMGANKLLLVSDSREINKKNYFFNQQVNIIYLLSFDCLIPKTHSFYSHFWRNSIKFCVLPFQALLLRRIYKRLSPMLIHAVPTYYMVMCWIARVPFIGTPQGSEVLVRSKKSCIYRMFAKKAYQAAKKVLVDSAILQKEISNQFSVKAEIVKDGFCTKMALTANAQKRKRSKIVSIRGLRELYQIHKIIEARNFKNSTLPIDFIYPFFDKEYEKTIRTLIYPSDILHGCLNKDEMYQILSEARLVISIPKTDSSPRSVYEAIFCGAPVAISKKEIYSELPVCMKKRVFLANLLNPNWFLEALEFADRLANIPFIPTSEGMLYCDEIAIFEKKLSSIYNLV